MKNIRAIACTLIIVGSVLVEVSYRLIAVAQPNPNQFWSALVQHILPAVVGVLLIHHGVKALLRPSA